MGLSEQCHILSVLSSYVTNTAEHVANTHFKKPSVVLSARLGSASVTYFQSEEFPSKPGIFPR